MKGRPKKYRKGRRVLLFLDESLVNELDTITNNRSDTINKLIEAHVKEKVSKRSNS